MSASPGQRGDESSKPQAALRVIVIGKGGRMANLCERLLQSSPDLEHAASFGSDQDWAGELVGSDAKPIAELGVDFTAAGLGFEHALRLLEAGIRPLVGTSGMDDDQVSQLDQRAQELNLGGRVVANFSVGALLLQAAASQLAQHFEQAEIIELHHAKKRDAPSQTARVTAAVLESRLGPVPIHSVRLPGLYAHQEVLLGKSGERLSLRHDMLNEEAFAPGILMALRALPNERGVRSGIADLLQSK